MRIFLENVILKVSQTDFPGLLTSLAEGIARRAMPSLFFFLCCGALASALIFAQLFYFHHILDRTYNALVLKLLN